MNVSKIFDSNKLLSEIEKVWGHAGAHYEVCKMLIKNNANWIRVTPKTLPELNQRVLVVDKYGFVETANYKKHYLSSSRNKVGFIDEQDEQNSELNPTHWMPLPTPPNDKNQ